MYVKVGALLREQVKRKTEERENRKVEGLKWRGDRYVYFKISWRMTEEEGREEEGRERKTVEDKRLTGS